MLVVAKVGGSLFDLPDLRPRLRAWLRTLPTTDVLLVPGGGAAADVIRDLDGRHHLGEEPAHWLALRAMALHAHFLAALLPSAVVIDDPLRRPASTWAILDAHAFLRADEGRPGSLPHSWAVTSDAVAARAAVWGKAVRLDLLKSVTIPAAMTWEEATRRGLVDATFPEVLRQAPQGLAVQAINLRAWSW